MNPICSHDVLVVIAAAMLLVLLWATRRNTGRCEPRLRWLLHGLRLAAACGLLLIALNPGSRTSGAARGQQPWLVLLDRSASMRTADVGGATRWDMACRTARAAAQSIPSRASLALHPFSGNLETSVAPGDLDRLTPDGTATDLLGAGAALLRQVAMRDEEPLGILLLTDGRQTQPRATTEFASLALARNVPVYPVCFGGDVPRRDLAVSAVRSLYVASVGQALTLSCRVHNQQLGDIRVKVKLIADQDAVVEEQAVQVANGGTAMARFDAVFTKPGYVERRFGVDPWVGETDTLNNAASVGIVALDHPIRVLLLEGTPYWDSKFLVQLLRRQANISITAVYRVASGKFFRIAAEGTGFLAEDQTPFPADAATMSRYDVVVFGRGIEYILTPAAVELLKSFVGEHGGSVVFARGKPYAGEFPELEPLEICQWGAPLAGEFRWRPTAAAEQAPFFAGALPPATDPAWRKLLPMRHALACERLKSFVTVLIEGVRQDAAPARVFPAVMTCRYGRGVVLAVNSEGLWQWDFVDADPKGREIYDRLWTQLIQWAVTCSEFLPGQDLTLRVSRTSVLPGERVYTEALRRPGAAVEAPAALHVRRDAATVTEVALSPVAGDANRWAAAFSLDRPGAYALALADRKKDRPGAVMQRIEVRRLPAEADDLSAAPEFLAALASQTGGRALAAADVAAVVGRPVAEAAAERETPGPWEPAWDNAWVALLLLALLTVEWFLRRRNGLL